MISRGAAAEQVEINNKLRANLASFWRDHGIDFALAWLTKSVEERADFVRSAVPDIKNEASESDPSDLLLPELNLSVLQAQQGRGLVALMQTRASLEESIEKADLAHCQKLDKAGQMPIFSGMEVAGKEGDAFAGKLAFVLDDGRVVVCDTEEQEKQNGRLVAEGKVLDANQFITKNVRRTVLLQFCCGLADKFLEEKAVRDAVGDDEGGRIKAIEKAVENVSKMTLAAEKAKEEHRVPGLEA